MSLSANRSNLMKLNSRALITYAVSTHGPLSRIQVARITKLSRAHVSVVVDELISDGVLVETGSVSGSRGRPMVLLEIDPNGAIICGVWLSDDALEVAIAAPSGNILVRSTLPYGGWTEDPVQAVDTVTERIRQCVEQCGKSIEQLKGVGVAVSGLVDPMLGTISITTNASEFEGLPIAEMLQDRLGVPVYADTDIRAGALAAQWTDGGCDQVLYMVFSDGVGSAYVSGHELLGGIHGAAPLFGHTVIDPNGPMCRCGGHGCLEVYASNFAFIRSLWPDLDPMEMTGFKREELVREGIMMASGGDRRAMRALAEVTKYMGIGVANAVNTLDPQVVYVTGVMVDQAPELVMDLVRREAVQHVWHLFRGVQIRALTRMSEFALQGAIGLVLWRPFRKLNERNSKILSLQGLSSEM